jgi:hypothetical protein
MQESMNGIEYGLMACARCRDSFGVIVEQRHTGFTKITAVQCLNCATTIPVRRGMVVWRPPFFYRLGWHLRQLFAGGAL